VSRASVLLDEALALGGGDRAGAALVLAELLTEDPVLGQMALAILGKRLMRPVFRVAMPWQGGGTRFYRFHLLRPEYVAEVQRFGTTWRVRVWLEGGEEQEVGEAETLEEGQRMADEVLRDGEERWWLQEGT